MQPHISLEDRLERLEKLLNNKEDSDSEGE